MDIDMYIGIFDMGQVNINFFVHQNIAMELFNTHGTLN